MDTKKKTILIVEDDEGILELLRDQIESHGFNTECIQNASNAIKWLKKNIPFLMLLDYQLPDMNSEEMILELRKDKIDIPPFVVSTGQGDEHVAVEMMKLGALDYIVKDNQFLEMIPIVVKRLADEIEKDLRLKKSELELSELSQFNHQIIQSAQEGILVFDLDLKYIIWNPFMEKLTGVKSSEVLGKNMLDAFPFLKDTNVLKNRVNSLKEETKEEIEYNFNMPASKREGWILETTSPLYNANKEIIGAISIVRDITKSKTTELSLKEKMDEMTRFHRMVVGRELAMVELKKEINELLKEAGKEEKYRIAE